MIAGIADNEVRRLQTLPENEANNLGVQCLTHEYDVRRRYLILAHKSLCTAAADHDSVHQILEPVLRWSYGFCQHEVMDVKAASVANSGRWKIVE